MARLIPEDEFRQLEDLARALLDRARDLIRGGAITEPDASVEEVALTEEAQAYANAAMALQRVTPLGEPAMFVAMGAAVGVALAQSMSPHAGLLLLMRNQEKATYDEVIRASQPATRTMQ